MAYRCQCVAALPHACSLFFLFLIDRTNGLAYVAGFSLPVVHCQSRTYCG